MAHKFFLDFQHNWISGQGVKIRGSDAMWKCYDYVISDVKNISPEKMLLVPIKSRKKEWLYGPATCLASRRIIYPCMRNKCSVVCPCLLCRKKHPTCRVPSSQACSCTDCLSHFEDHTNFHATFHVGCKFCFQITNIFPQFNFFFLDKKKRKSMSGSYTERSISEYCWLLPGQKFSNSDWREKLHNWKNDIKDDGIWCNSCCILFGSIGLLKDHIKSKHLVSKSFSHHYLNCYEKAPTEFDCSQCSVKFASRRDLQRHVESVNYEEKIDCKFCPLVFTRKDSHDRHILYKHDVYDEACDVCGIRFKSSAAFIKHLEKKEHSKLQCDQCGQTFGHKSDMNRHVKNICNSQGGQSSFECEQCRKKFTRNRDLDRHCRNSLNNDGSAKYICDQCSEPLCNRKLLMDHIKSKHGDFERKFKCYKCSTSYTTESELKTHEETVHFPETHKCEICPKTFANKDNLKRHKVNHKMPEKLECNLCNTNFGWRMSLQKHKREAFNSDGSPRYVCDQCGDQFCTGKLMRAHIISVHRKFLCSICDQSFSLKHHLELHVKKRIQFPCDECDNTFCNQRSIRNHMLDVHNKCFVKK